MIKKKFVLRIDSNLLEAVEKWASDEFRSVNGQLEWIISDTLKRYKRSKKTGEQNLDKPE
jgi:hypothetical protein